MKTICSTRLLLMGLPALASWAIASYQHRVRHRDGDGENDALELLHSFGERGEQRKTRKPAAFVEKADRTRTHATCAPEQTKTTHAQGSEIWTEHPLTYGKVVREQILHL